jgi:hypothetical protein
MSRLLILFLIALLPLRGWTAQRMVLDMEAQAAVVSMVQQSGMSEDCALHMGMQVQAASHADDNQDKLFHKGCQSCDICMPLAALDTEAGMALLPATHTLPLRPAGAFQSAEPARYAKPPIS